MLATAPKVLIAMELGAATPFQGVGLTLPTTALAGWHIRHHSRSRYLPPRHSAKFGPLISAQSFSAAISRSATLHSPFARDRQCHNRRRRTFDALSVPFSAPPAAGYDKLEVSLLAGGDVLWSNSAAPPLWLWSIPPWLSIIPPIITVLLALLLRNVIVALAIGVWLSATIVHGGNPLVGGLRLVDIYLPQALGGGSHPLILVFTYLLGGTIAVVRASGGAAGLARIATRCTKKPSHVLLAAATLGLFVGVDDYASVLITGSAMEPVAAALGIHPLRLCWVVHGIGVCMASLHPLGSWFGVELALVAEQLNTLPGLKEAAPSALILTLTTIPYRYFPLIHIMHILLQLIVPWAVDYGQMVKFTQPNGGSTSYQLQPQPHHLLTALPSQAAARQPFSKRQLSRRLMAAALSRFLRRACKPPPPPRAILHLMRQAL